MAEGPTLTDRKEETMSTSITTAARAPEIESGPLEIGFATGECSLGTILVARTRRGVAPSCSATTLRPSRAISAAGFPRHWIRRDSETDTMLAAVTRLIESPGLELYLPLDPRGTPFQLEVWQALREYPRRHDRELLRGRAAHRGAGFGTCRGAGLRGQRAGGGDSVPSSGAGRRQRLGLSMGRRAKAGAPGARGAGVSAVVALPATAGAHGGLDPRPEGPR